MRSSFRLLMPVLGLTLCSSISLATTIIDDFNNNMGSISLTQTSVGSSQDGPDAVPIGVYGRRRTATLTVESNQLGPPNGASMALNPPDNQLDCRSDTGVSATFSLFYGGPSDYDIGDLDPDFDGTTQFEIVFSAADQGAQVTIMLMQNLTTTSKSVAMTVPGAQVLAIPYAGGWSGGYTIGEGAFNEIDTITLTINGSVAGDYIVNEFRTGAVPEPSTLTLTTLASALGVMRRRVRRVRSRTCVKSSILNHHSTIRSAR